MNDDQRLLASAVVDDAATSDEQARAEADPQVRAEIDRLRAVREQLRTGVAPDPDQRESTIAAALAAFDRRRRRHRAPAAFPRGPPPGPLAGARWPPPPPSSSSSSAPSSPGATTTEATTRHPRPPSWRRRPPTIATMPGPRRHPPRRRRPARRAPTLPQTPEAASEESADQLVATAPADAEVLRTPEELATFAQRRTALDAPAGESTCAVGTPLGPALFVVGGVNVPVDVFEVDGEAVAVDPVDCRSSPAPRCPDVRLTVTALAVPRGVPGRWRIGE